MGKVAKGKLCDVAGCGRAAVRSLSREVVARAGLKIGGQGRVYLCKEHYKLVKKKLKKDSLLKKWRYMAAGP